MPHRKFVQPIRDTSHLGSDASSVWNFCTRFSDVINVGKPAMASRNVGCFFQVILILADGIFLAARKFYYSGDLTLEILLVML